MPNCRSFVNSLFTSVSYVVEFGCDKEILIVDPGDSDQLIEYMVEHELVLKGILLTHGHFDHIYGINSLLDIAPSCRIYTNSVGVNMLKDAKLNMSKYHDNPYTVDRIENAVVLETDQKFLVSPTIEVEAFFTPGHNASCITWVINDMVFTGDSYIPGVKVVTNLPGGNKELSLESLNRISVISIDRIIYPGHAV